MVRRCLCVCHVVRLLLAFGTAAIGHEFLHDIVYVKIEEMVAHAHLTGEIGVIGQEFCFCRDNAAPNIR